MARVLIIGSGGREHALTHTLATTPEVSELYVSPGNAGTAREPNTQNVTLTDHQAAIEFCQTNQIDLVVIGPETPLVAGLADDLRAQGIVVFGPNTAGAQLEGSKSFATEFMQRHGIAIPKSCIVHNKKDALAAVADFGGAKSSVIKADGLAGGKGVFLPSSETEAAEAIAKIAAGNVDGDGSTFVIQNREAGPEVSVFVLSDGQDYKIIPLASQDHKRLQNGDKGPNTGGMGVYAPLPDWMVSPRQWAKIERIAQQTIEGLKADGIPYVGVIYLGIMLSEHRGGDPIVIEYNARFGDPETEVVIPLLQGNGINIYDMLYATATGKLASLAFPSVLNGAALTICLAAAGYPDTPEKGETIHGLNEDYKNVDVYHGSTVTQNNAVVTSGGRVLFVTGFGPTLAAASEAANAAIGPDGIHFKGMQYRSDIAWRALKP